MFLELLRRTILIKFDIKKVIFYCFAQINIKHCFQFSFLEGLSGWSQSVIGNHPMHQQLSDPNTFSQHQPMERDDSGMVAPTNIFHQPMVSGFVDFSTVNQHVSL